jgi:hypothetical protein
MYTLPAIIFLILLGCLFSFSSIRDILRILSAAAGGINALPPSGRVEISGKVQPASLTSPISRKACAFWQVEVKEKKDRAWEIIYQGSSQESLEIKDATGTVKIRPQGARLILNRELAVSSGAQGKMDSHTREALQKMKIELQDPLGGEKNLAVLEWLLKPGEQIYVLAEIHETAGQAAPADRISPLLVSDRSKRELLKELYQRVAVNVFLTAALGGLILIFIINIGLKFIPK